MSSNCDTHEPGQTTYQLKVTLRGSKPSIWRRLQVSSDIGLAELHHTLQIAMGWEDMHLHEFIAAKRRYGIPDPDFPDDTLDEFEFSIDELLGKEGDKLVYLYDFGDGWEHDLLLEKITPTRARGSLPQCTAGARACPPEDSGGIPGYERMLKIVRKPSHEEYDELLEWLGEDFDPAAFDKGEVNEMLRRFGEGRRLFTRLMGVLTEVGEHDGEGLDEADEVLLFRYFPEGGNVQKQQANFDSLQGYLTAVICAPNTLFPTEWMMFLLEKYTLQEIEESDFAPLIAALLKLYNRIAADLDSGHPQFPQPDDFRTEAPGTTPIELWSDGFLHGFTFNEGEWFNVEDEEIEEEVNACASLISAIAMRRLENENMPEAEFYEKMAMVQEILPKSIFTLYELARSEHYAAFDEELFDPFDDPFGQEPPQPAHSDKIGRNEPCPCGSGLKYKKCCINKIVPLH